MSTSREEVGVLIDAYLDGAMTPAERGAFEARVGTDDALAAEVELQRRIDDRIGALFAPPDGIDIPGPNTREGDGSGGADAIPIRTRRVPAWVKVAAVLAIVTLGAWAAWTRPWAGLMGPAPSDIPANVCYNELVKGGLKPIWKCESDEVFRKYTHDQLGASFVIGADPTIEVVGWTYASGLLDSTAQVLMCRVDGNASIVVVGKKSDDRVMRVEPGSGVKLHREEKCGLVMYELNKRCDAPVLGHVVCE